MTASLIALLSACSPDEALEQSGDPLEEVDAPASEPVSGAGLRKGMPGAENGMSDYCDGFFRCGAGEGDCDSSLQCAAGLACISDNGGRYATSYQNQQDDHCAPATCNNRQLDPGEAGVDCGGTCGSCTTRCELPNGHNDRCMWHCQCPSRWGDCDADVQCAGYDDPDPLRRAVCVADVGARFSMVATQDVCLPGHCANRVIDAGEGGVDCGGDNECGPCTCPSTIPGSECTPSCPCGEAGGDCDTNIDCTSGFFCREEGTVDRCREIGWEIEPNNSAQEANDFAALAVSGGVNARFTPGDADVFRFVVPAGMTGSMRAEARDSPLGPTCSGLAIDTVFRLRDAAGALVAQADDHFTRCSLLAIGLNAGTYYLEVTNGPWLPAPTTSYRLSAALALRAVGVARCEDGVLDPGEQCDDRDTTQYSGCSSQCTVVPGFYCYDTPSRCAGICGDGLVVADERCDDRNNYPGDGCTGCQPDPGFTCNGQPSVCVAGTCGDGFKSNSELCDDGNATAGDGCSAQCEVEPGYVCFEDQAGRSFCQPGRCGDWIVTAPEQCDIPGGGETGCTAECTTVPGWQCNDPLPWEPSHCTPICGDLIIVRNENCDDGNAMSGDGCSQDCRSELGFNCPQPGPCITVCGDGWVRGTEQCDDAGMTPGDGCSASCMIEPGWSCFPPPSEPSWCWQEVPPPG